MRGYILILILIGISNLICAQQQIYVAKSGDDNNAGTMELPLRTLQAAIAKASSSKQHLVTIQVRSGKYAQDKTIILTPALLKGHHITITSFKDEKVIITGAIPVVTKWTTYKGAVLQTILEKGLSIDQVFCNGLTLHMARYPNYDSSARVFNGTAADAISPQKVKNWSDPSGAYVHAIHKAEWGDFHYIVKAKRGDSLVLEGGWQNNRPSAMHERYRFIENVFEELDAPGEWFYNKSTGILYLYPPVNVNPDKVVFERSILENIIEIKGNEQLPAEGIKINGITFTGTSRTFMEKKEPLLRTDWTIYRSGAILTEGAKDINISRCIFTELGGNAVFISKFNRGIVCEHNHIFNVGANAFAVIGDTGSVRSPAYRYEDFVPIEKMDRIPGPKTNNFPADCMVFDNLIHNIGTIEKQVAGIEIDIAKNIKASHNTIYNVPRAGINIGDGCFGGHIIEYNDVFNTVLETGDHGAFNSWGRDRYWLPGINEVNQLVEKNPELPLLDVIEPIILRNNRFKCEHGWDIDLDDGSSNYRIYNNVCLNGGLKLREGYKRIVTNNILVNNTFHPHVWYSKSEDVFAHNIVTSPYAPIRVNEWGKMVDSNLFIQKNALQQAQKNSTDKNSVEGDPGFVKSSEGNFTVKATSKALTVGFKNFDMETFGVVSGNLKKFALKPAIIPLRAIGNMKKGETTQWLGATIKNVETLGEQSASGLPDRKGVLLVHITAGTLADKSGLLPGDVIRKINGKEIINVGDLVSTLQAVMWQGHASASIWHNQDSKEVQLLLK